MQLSNFELKMSQKKYLLLVIYTTFLMVLVTSCDPSETTTSVTQTPIPATASSLKEDSTLTVKKLSIIYVDDGSRDGTVALLYLLSQPEITMLAINISYGEAHPDIYIQHIGSMLDSLGYGDIPLGVGQDAPLAAGTPFPEWLRQLSDNFWNYQLPNADKTYPVQSAPELMVTSLKQAPEPATIFMSGTFTTLAQALRLDPSIQEKIEAVYIMGGAVYVPGNITNLIPDSSNKVAEWNVIADPQAAVEVLDADLDLYLIPLDSTNKVIFHSDDIQPWHNGDEKAKIAADLYDIMFNEYGWEVAEIFDLGAAVIMVKPETCVFESLHLKVITDDGNKQGQMTVIPDREPNINVCLNPNADLIMKALNDSFTSSNNTLETPQIDPILGTWTGSVLNNDFEMQMTITIEETCRLEQICGRFDITTVSCSGSLRWVGMDGEMYQFEAIQKTEACGEGADYILPQTDESVIYISRGDYGETKGTLYRKP